MDWRIHGGVSIEQFAQHLRGPLATSILCALAPGDFPMKQLFHAGMELAYLRSITCEHHLRADSQNIKTNKQK